MGDYQKVEIVRDGDPEGAAQEAEMQQSLQAELQQQQEAQQEQPAEESMMEKSTEAPERPEWLPDKFVSPEAMAKAYNELEGMMSQSKPEETQEGELEPLSNDDFAAFGQELQMTGEVSEESKQQMIDWGLPREVVEAHIAGQQARLQLEIQSVQNEVGGSESYEQMIEWATQHLDEADQNAFDQAVTQGNMEQMTFAVRSLKARWEASGGRSGNLIQGDTSAAQSYSGYRSLAELTSAMKDPRYRDDRAYRKDVETRLANSDIL
tara:strand:- start:93 stop:887 length:795 start_codon:yes stop_codon:yes gene_type:complete